ncbi:hypothetical protein Tco_0752110 [Tanacetum coccineum]|uniref:Uncharacterized protein n=1 Tax=Tanacetum coccineum TaxID=301880 RepID=A0ABQ4Z5W9_9ASTR
MKIMKLRQNAVKNPRQNAMEYGLQAKRNGVLEQNAVMLKQNAMMNEILPDLATNQQFNMSKYIFDAMVKHLDRGVKFLLYQRFLQAFINQQLVLLAGEAVTTASIDDSVVPTTNEEITLAQTLIQIKAAKPKEPSEFRVSQETQLQGSKDKGKARGLFMYMKARKEGSKVLEKTPKVAEKDAWNEEAAGKKPAERNP